MHIPDGFIDGGTSFAAGAAAVVGVGACLRRSTEALEDEHAPIAGAVAAFVFAGQMLNFPVAGGTSGHVIGAALATALVGPYLASVCITAVLVVQALLFADGGLTALGLNVLNMALVGVFAAHAVLSLGRRVLAAASGVAVSASAAAFVSILAAAVVFSFEYAIGGQGTAPAGTVTAAMLGVHLLIGLGEAVITGLAVSAVMAARPDLVHAAQTGRAPERWRPELVRS